MPPPTTTTSYCFIALDLREIALGCVNPPQHTTFCHLSLFANSVLMLAQRATKGRGRFDPVDSCAKRMEIRGRFDPVDSCAKRMEIRGRIDPVDSARSA